MKSFIFACLLTFLLCGCKSLNNLTEGVSNKSLSGSGTVTQQAVDIDPSTGSPRLKNFVLTGKYASALKNQNAMQYEKKKSPSIFNPAAVEEVTTINFVGGNEGFKEAVKILAEKICEKEQSK